MFSVFNIFRLTVQKSQYFKLFVSKLYFESLPQCVACLTRLLSRSGANLTLEVLVERHNLKTSEYSAPTSLLRNQDPLPEDNPVT